MKTLKLLAIGIILLLSNASNAQLSVNVNIGTPPAWGPSGYSNVDYYYLPDIEAYYDIRDSQFIYYGNGTWIRSRYLPRQFRNYDLYNGYKVVLNNYHGNSPYNNFQNHSRVYRVGYRGHYQKTVGHRHFEQRYAQRPIYSRNRRYDDNRRYASNSRYYDKHDNSGHNNQHGNKGHHRD
jgi:hypothetical protein